MDFEDYDVMYPEEQPDEFEQYIHFTILEAGELIEKFGAKLFLETLSVKAYDALIEEIMP